MSGPQTDGAPLSSRAGAGEEETRGGSHGASSQAGGVGVLARVVFAALVLACFAALIVTQRLKHTPTLIQEFKLTPRFAPASAGPHRLEAISFKLAEADEVTVRIVRSSGGAVATLVRDRPVARYKKLSLRWNGREGGARGYSVLVSPHGYRSLLPANRGRVAPAGEYSVSIGLRAQNRTIPLPRNFKLVMP